jgi:hypothetical protein
VRARALRLAGLLALYALAVFLLTFAARQHGWYPNHETYSGFERVESWRRAFASGDWLPLWTPFCNNGHGCPTPLMYHRLFNAVAALLAVFLGTDAGLRLAIVLVLIVAALGMHRAVRSLGAPVGLCIGGALLFVTAPYVLTDWLVRGAFAEFAAMAIMPWLLSGVICLARGENAGLELGVTTALLFHAHSVICFFVLPLLLIAGLVGLAAPRHREVTPEASSLRGWRKLRARFPVFFWAGSVVLRFTAAFVVLTGPFVMAIWLMSNQLTLEYLAVSHPARSYLPLGRYVVDLYDSVDPYGYSVEIGRWLLMLLVAFAAVAWTLRAKLERAVIALGLGGLLYVWLLHPSSSGVYYGVPGAALLQFPWRLVVLLLPITVLLVCAFGLSIITLQPRGVRAVAAMLGLVIVGQALNMLDAQKVTHRLTSRELKSKIEALDGPNNTEYLPKGVGASARTPFVGLRGCLAVGAGVPEAAHLGEVEFTVEAPIDCTVELSQFCSPLLEVTASRGKPGCSGAGTFLVDIPAGAPVKVRIARRGLWAMIVAELAKK